MPAEAVKLIKFCDKKNIKEYIQESQLFVHMGGTVILFLKMSVTLLHIQKLLFIKDDFRYTYDINNYLNKPKTNSEDSWVYCGDDKPVVEVTKPTRELSLKEHAKVMHSQPFK